MSTLVVSDLHVGARNGADVVRDPELRAPLLEAVAGAERVVLLGDAIELRDGPSWKALRDARDFFSALGAAAGRDTPIVLTPGNHDHALLGDWLAARRRDGPAPPLGLEQRIPAADASPAAATLADWVAPARLELAYPGLWLRDDVYALHGHYLDLHATVPSFERLGARAVDRFLRGRQVDRHGGAEDYEGGLQPIYALLGAVAEVASPEAGTGGSGASTRAWRVLVGDGGRRRAVRHRLLAGLGYPLAVAALNAAGLGPVQPDLSGVALRRASLEAMGEVVAHLGIRADHVLFGHSHRAGPFPGDDPSEWTTATGTRLTNTGSWVYEPTFLGRTAAESPYWPGAAVTVEATGPPRLRTLLHDRTHEQLRSGPARARG